MIATSKPKFVPGEPVLIPPPGDYNNVPPEAVFTTKTTILEYRGYVTAICQETGRNLGKTHWYIIKTEYGEEGGCPEELIRPRPSDEPSSLEELEKLTGYKPKEVHQIKATPKGAQQWQLSYQQ